MFCTLRAASDNPIPNVHYRRRVLGESFSPSSRPPPPPLTSSLGTPHHSKSCVVRHPPIFPSASSRSRIRFGDKDGPTINMAPGPGGHPSACISAMEIGESGSHSPGGAGGAYHDLGSEGSMPATPVRTNRTLPLMLWQLLLFCLHARRAIMYVFDLTRLVRSKSEHSRSQPDLVLGTRLVALDLIPRSAYTPAENNSPPPTQSNKRPQHDAPVAVKLLEL